MAINWEAPTLLFKIGDMIGNCDPFGVFYTRYINSLKLKGNETLLDFGSGSGAGSRHLAKILQTSGGHLTCVDTSHYLTAKAQKRMHECSNVSFFTQPITQLRLPPDSFDVIYVSYALHEVTGELRRGIVKEFFRLLGPGGRLCIREPHIKIDGMPVSEIRRLMKSSGFKEESSKKTFMEFSGIYIKSQSKIH